MVYKKRFTAFGGWWCGSFFVWLPIGLLVALLIGWIGLLLIAYCFADCLLIGLHYLLIKKEKNNTTLIF